MQATKTELQTILLIDDDPATQLINKKMLGKAGLGDLNIAEAYDGGEGVDYIKNRFESDANAMPNLVFLDINMPAFDGWDFLDDFEKLPQEIKDTVVVIMLSTSFNPDDEDRANEHPLVKKFYQKPLTVEKINEVLSEFFS